jgi:hypothetical protein
MRKSLYGTLAIPLIAATLSCAAADKRISATKPSTLPKTYEECIERGGYKVAGAKGEMCKVDYMCSKEPKLCQLCMKEGFGTYVIEGGLGPDGSISGGDSGCSFRIYKDGNRLAKSNWAD